MEGLNPQQTEFLANYIDPKSATFGNAYKSAIKAKYKEEYARVIINSLPKWLSENVGKKERLIMKAERRLEEFIGSRDQRIGIDATKFTLARLKKEEYSDRTEVTGKDGKDLNISIIKYGDNDSVQIPTEKLPTTDSGSDRLRKEKNNTSVAPKIR